MNERKPSISLPELAVDCHQHQWSVLVCHILGSPRNSHFLKLSTVWWYRRAVPLGISFDFPGSCCCPIPFHVYWPFVVLLWGSCSYTVNVLIESLASKLLLVVDTYVLQVTGVFGLFFYIASLFSYMAYISILSAVFWGKLNLILNVFKCFYWCCGLRRFIIHQGHRPPI